jgi:hypothetical protein
VHPSDYLIVILRGTFLPDWVLLHRALHETGMDDVSLKSFLFQVQFYFDLVFFIFVSLLN